MYSHSNTVHVLRLMAFVLFSWRQDVGILSPLKPLSSLIVPNTNICALSQLALSSVNVSSTVEPLGYCHYVAATSL